MYSPIDEIKNKLDVVEVIQSYLRLQKAGRNYKALCPFHSEKTPSFSVSPERQMWYCFGCSKGGSIFDFVMQIEGVEFGDALKTLAQRAGVELKKTDPKLRTEKTHLYEICQLASRFFEKQLEASGNGQLAHKYLKERGLKSETIRAWQIGYAPDKWRALLDFLGSRGYGYEEIFKAGLSVEKNKTQYYDRFRRRIIFPVFDISGAIIGFSGRIFGEGEPKYLNTSNTLIYDKSRVLYGLDRAKMEIRKEDLCVLVEGQMDVVMSHQAGIVNVIASSGTALTGEHLKIIKRYTDNLAIAFDMDLAGEMAAKKGIDLAVAVGFNIKVVQMPANQDPADCLGENPAIWIEAIKKAQSIVEFYFSTVFSRFNQDLVEGKKEIAKILLPILKKIPNKIEQGHWIQELARRLKTEEKVLIEEIKEIKEAKPEIHSENILNSSKNDFQNKFKNQQEEYLLSLLAINPELVEHFKEYPSYLFTDLDLAEIFKRIKKSKTFSLDSFNKILPSNLSGRLGYLALRADALYGEKISQDESFSPKEEVEFCFTQLKSRYLRQKMRQLSLTIKEAEGKRDEVARKSQAEEFNKLSKQMATNKS